LVHSFFVNEDVDTRRISHQTSRAVNTMKRKTTIEMSAHLQQVNRLTKTWVGSCVLAALFWTLLSVFFSLPHLAAGKGLLSMREVFAWCWSWGLVAPFILAFDRRLPFSGKQIARRIFAHLIAGLLFTVAYRYVNVVAMAAFGIGPWDALRISKTFSLWTFNDALWSWFFYWVIVATLQAHGYYRRYLSTELRLERMERSLTEARLNALRMQLDPHFLFNALNTISSHVERNPKLTRRMIEHLGDLLRRSLETKDRQEVPLAEELAFLAPYLAIQKIRFGEKLQIEMQIEPEVQNAIVPSLMLQPLVENAIRHGISHRAAGGTVIVSAQKVDEQLEIRIQDDGVGLPLGWTLESSAGLGLSVTRERVKSLHPNGESSFAIRPRRDAGVEVDIFLPLRVHEGDFYGRA
jgi:two-component sensor histidine kinase